MPNGIFDWWEILRNPNFTHEEAFDIIERRAHVYTYESLREQLPRHQPATPIPSHKKTRKRAAIAMKRLDSKVAWRELSADPNLRFVFVRQHLGKPWDWDGVSRNLSIGIGDVLENLHLPWNWYGLSMTINFGDMLANRFYGGSVMPWKWECVSENPTLTYSDVIANPDIPWSRWRLSENKFNKHPVLRARLEKLAAKEDAAIARMAAAGLREFLPAVLVAMVLKYVF
jgi:hypothetical protein